MTSQLPERLRLTPSCVLVFRKLTGISEISWVDTSALCAEGSNLSDRFNIGGVNILASRVDNADATTRRVSTSQKNPTICPTLA
jgi:hypothetical protein